LQDGIRTVQPIFVYDL